MRKTQIAALAALLCVLVLAGVVSAEMFSANYGVPWDARWGGGGLISSTNYTINATVGQGAIGWTDSANYGVGAGYWYGAVLTVDVSPPAVVAMAPGSGAVNVALTAPVVVTFNEAINTSTFAYTVVPDPGGWSATWSGGDAVVTLPHDPFASQTTYTVTVTAAEDLVGNPLAGAPYAWHFTTVSYRLYLPLVLKSFS